ncbi:hypothetical protein O1611_g4487 [Lasiodiplodia mahajangana]|uniref:Uncharacterized protein n=1 Tax=Lasiodiplodia mahajangana TaxID=1108764 RepID=A0ACC2JNZ6_9PEZI|nr:hypothetical protein O1611_g4487 [Lasiodiplodia mahajangana]
MDDAEDTATAMAAAMGFSSFGAQKPNKRRKFNPSTDAFVAPISPSTSASTSASALPFHRYNANHAATTGSNTVPLGQRRQNTNADEIDLDDDDDDENAAQVSPEDEAAQQITTNDDDEDPEPQYLDTSRPSAPIVADPADDLQSKIDAIVGNSAGPYTPVQPSSLVAGSEYSSRGGRGEWHRNINRDQSGTKWWESYYDPAFIVNPWDSLEKDKGLEPRGTWVSWEEAKAVQP